MKSHIIRLNEYFTILFIIKHKITLTKNQLFFIPATSENTLTNAFLSISFENLISRYSGTYFFVEKSLHTTAALTLNLFYFSLSSLILATDLLIKPEKRVAPKKFL